jgi:hypothetical protein
MNTSIGELSCPASLSNVLSLTILGTAFGAGLHIVLASENDLVVTNKVCGCDLGRCQTFMLTHLALVLLSTHLHLYSHVDKIFDTHILSSYLRAELRF